MTPKMRVSVCGNSVYMASLAAGLRAYPALEVARLATAPETWAESLRDPSQEVIVFDLADIPVYLPIALLRECPDLLLLGMDPTSDELLVLSGHSAQALSVSDLVGVIVAGAEMRAHHP